MRYVEVSGSRWSVIGLGTWQFGSTEWGYGAAYAEVEAGLIVDRALEGGVNFVDTAEMYGFGASERIVGRAIAGRRDEVVVATKLFPLLPVDPVVRRRAEASARRLGVEAIDLYQLHWPNPLVPIGITMTAMARLVSSGLVRRVGVSNYSLAQWKAAEANLGEPVVSNQVQHSLLYPADPAMLQWAADRGRVVIAYSPLAKGLLGGRFRPGFRPRGMRAVLPAFSTESLRRLEPLLGLLEDIGRAHDATPAQVALAWVVHRPGIVAIPGASSVRQVASNVEAAELRLSDEEFEALGAQGRAWRSAAAWEPVAERLRARRSGAR
jgi:aryl-alcohol dehydrogenase-like predicted oxidoreductase